MNRQLFATTAISLFLASAANAQTTSETTARLGETWDQETVIALFEEGDGLTLRREADIQNNWAELSAAEQDKVRADCAVVLAGLETDGDLAAAESGEPVTDTSATRADAATAGQPDAVGAMDPEGPATGTPASDTDVADAGGPDVPTASEPEVEATATAAATADRPSTADGGIFGSTRSDMGAAAGAASDSSATDPLVEAETDTADSAAAVSDVSGAQEAIESADAAIVLDVPETDWQELCDIVAQADAR